MLAKWLLCLVPSKWLIWELCRREVTLHDDYYLTRNPLYTKLRLQNNSPSVTLFDEDAYTNHLLEQIESGQRNKATVEAWKEGWNKGLVPTATEPCPPRSFAEDARMVRRVLTESDPGIFITPTLLKEVVAQTVEEAYPDDDTANVETWVQDAIAWLNSDVEVPETDASIPVFDAVPRPATAPTPFGPAEVSMPFQVRAVNATEFTLLGHRYTVIDCLNDAYKLEGIDGVYIPSEYFELADETA